MFRKCNFKKYVMLLIILTCLLINSCSGLQNKNPKSIILLIGDGMGIGQLTADYYFNESKMILEFPVCGIYATHPKDGDWITDSAASGTAISTGVKVKNGVICLSEDREKLETVLELAERIGKSTGLVATSSITHATPASFAAHVSNRGMEYEIAVQESQSGADVLFGGGLRFFTENTVLDSNLIQGMIENGYEFISQQSQLEILDIENIEKIIGLFADEALSPANKRDLSLAMMTQKAVNVLDNNENGFFLMVEGSQIDWRCHEGNADGLLYEMQDFTEAVNWALKYQKSNKEVLILVLADHETGGVCVESALTHRENGRITFATGNHSANFCVVLAKGPGQEQFSGFREIDDIGKILHKLIK
jgi:alkaline phosphatase